MNPIVLLPKPGTHADIESLATIAGLPVGQILRSLEDRGCLTVTPHDSGHAERLLASAHRFGFKVASEADLEHLAGMQRSDSRAPSPPGAPGEEALDAAQLWASAAVERPHDHADVAGGAALPGTATATEAPVVTSHAPPQGGTPASPAAFALPEVPLRDEVRIHSPPVVDDESRWPRSLLVFALVAAVTIFAAAAALVAMQKDPPPASSMEPSRAVDEGGVRAPPESSDSSTPPPPENASTGTAQGVTAQPEGSSAGTQGRRRPSDPPANPLVRGLVMEAGEACDERDWDRCLRLAERALQMESQSRAALALRIRAMAGQSEDAEAGLNDPAVFESPEEGADGQ